MKKLLLPILTLASLAAIQSSKATDYNGNGLVISANGAFTGAVGGGMLSLTDDGTTVYGTFTRGPDTTGSGGGNGQFNNNLVLFIDSVSGGFANTSGFQDAGDQSRRAISGYNNSTQFSVMTFGSGFLPDYAISLRAVSGSSFGGLWQLANGGNNSMPFVQNVSLSPLNDVSAASYTFSFSLASIGITPGAGETFSLFGSFISNTGYRSGEFIAGDAAVDGSAAPATKGWVPFNQSSFGEYTTTVVPEPAALSLLALAATLVTVRRHRG